MANLNKNIKRKSQMQNNTKIMIAVAVVVVIIAIAAIARYSMSNNKAAPLITSPTTLNSAAASTSGPVKLANSQYASYAYLIYPNSSKNNYVAAGFNITINNLNNGSVKVTIAALGNTGSNTNFTFPANYELYYIDQSIGDDAPPSSDYVAADDHVVLVNSSGYIVGNIISP